MVRLDYKNCKLNTTVIVTSYTKVSWPSSCITTYVHLPYDNCFPASVYASLFIFFFQIDVDEHQLLLVTCLISKQTLLILKDCRKSIIACTCTENKCGMCESSTSFNNTDNILLTIF